MIVLSLLALGEKTLRHDKLGPLLLKRLRESGLDADVVAEFMGITAGTVLKWNEERLPQGEKLNKLWHLLALVGLESPEMEKVPQLGWYVGKLMAFGVISLEEARHICRVKNPQAVLYAIRGEQTPSNPSHTLEELQTIYSQKLAAKMEEAKALLPNQLPVAKEPASQAVLVTTEPPAQPAATSLLTHFEILKLARQLSAAMPTLRVLTSGEATDEDRAYLREVMGERGIFELGNLIEALSSHRAFNSTRG